MVQLGDTESPGLMYDFDLYVVPVLYPVSSQHAL